MPNLILAGPPGCGKTTSVQALARELLGDAYDRAVLELNASDSRGIDVVRNTMKTFAKKKVTLPPGRHKIIILDEADSMTQGAQQAMRRTMELYSATTRFALACNTSSKIIEPIQSRCAIVRYTRLSEKEILSRVMEVMRKEKVVQYDDKGLEAIVFTAQGDMRHALNNLQSTFAGTGAITADNVFKVVDQPHPTLIQDTLKFCVALELQKAINNVRGLWDQGYTGLDIIGTVFRVCKTALMEERLKLEFIKEIGTTHMRMGDGCDSFLQLAALMSRLCNIARTITGR